MNPPYVQENTRMESVEALKAGQNAPPPYLNPYPNLNDTAYAMTQQNAGQMPVYGNQPPPPPPGLGVNVNIGYPQPYPNQRQGPNGQVIIVQQNRGPTPCPFCRNTAPVVPIKEMGCAIWVWSCIFFWFTGCCCWVPCVIDDCYDTRLQCSGCLATREVIKSRYSL